MSSPAADGSKQKPAPKWHKWTRVDTTKLIGIWAEPEILEKFIQKNSRGLYAKMSERLAALDVKRSEDEVSNKVKKLEAKYKKASNPFYILIYFVLVSFCVNFK